MGFLQYWGNWIRSQRKARGYTVDDFSKLTNVSINQIHHIERGDADSRKETLERIINVLGDENAYNAIVSYVEQNIHDYTPLIQALEQLPPEERSKGIQKIFSIIT